MWLVLKIALAIILAVVVLLVIAFFWFKRTILASVAHAGAINALAPPLPPARLRLRATSSAIENTDIQAFWLEAVQMGCVAVTNLHFNSGEFRLGKLGRFVLLVGELGAATPWIVCALSTNKKLYACSTIDPLSVARESFVWHGLAPDASLSQAYDALKAEIGDLPLLDLGQAQCVQLIERAYAAFADDLLISKLPLLDPNNGIAALAKLHPNVAEDKLRLAHASVCEDINTNLHESLLDQFKRLQTLDIVAWERIEATLEIVHAGVRAQDLLERADSNFRRLLQQHLDQDLPIMAAYQLANAALPEAERKIMHAQLTRPVRAQVYLNDMLAYPQENAATSATPKGASEFPYQAEKSGKPMFGTVLATSGVNATRQLRAQGFEEVKILAEAFDLQLPIQDAALYAKAVRNSLERSPARNLLGLVLNAAVFWGPAFAWALWNLWQGPEFTTMDYLSFGVFVVVVYTCLKMVVPVHLYERYYHFKNSGNWQQSQRFLQHRWFMRGIAEPMKVLEQAKLLAHKGELSAALALWCEQRAHVDESAYLSGLALIHCAGGDNDAFVSVSERLLPLSANPSMVELDLAVMLLREGGQIERAETLLLKHSSTELSALAQGYYHFARGLLQAAKGEHKFALRQFHYACEGFPVQSAVTQGAVSMFRAYQALSLKKLGQAEEARAIWAAVSHQIKPHATFAKLVGELDAP